MPVFIKANTPILQGLGGIAHVGASLGKHSSVSPTPPTQWCKKGYTDYFLGNHPIKSVDSGGVAQVEAS